MTPLLFALVLGLTLLGTAVTVGLLLGLGGALWRWRAVRRPGGGQAPAPRDRPP
jgi:hypothetical protein